jgi:hypothetical protein
MGEDEKKKQYSENLLGHVLVREIGIPLRILHAALSHQRERGGKLGQILIDMAAITAEDLQRALDAQRQYAIDRAEDRPAFEAETMVGAILVLTAELSLKTLQDALDRQKRDGGMLGEILVAMDAVTEEELELALRLQRMRRAPAKQALEPID